MMNGLVNNRMITTMLLLACVVMAGCGRKGPLEPPPSAAISQTQPEDAEKPAPVPERRFILDGII